MKPGDMNKGVDKINNETLNPLGANPTNDQTHLNNLPATVDELSEWVLPFCGGD